MFENSFDVFNVYLCQFPRHETLFDKRYPVSVWNKQKTPVALHFNDNFWGNNSTLNLRNFNLNRINNTLLGFQNDNQKLDWILDFSNNLFPEHIRDRLIYQCISKAFKGYCNRSTSGVNPQEIPKFYFKAFSSGQFLVTA